MGQGKPNIIDRILPLWGLAVIVFVGLFFVAAQVDGFMSGDTTTTLAAVSAPSTVAETSTTTRPNISTSTNSVSPDSTSSRKYNANQYGCHNDGRCLDGWDKWCEEDDLEWSDAADEEVCPYTADRLGYDEADDSFGDTSYWDVYDEFDR